MLMPTLPLAIDLADLAARAAAKDEPLNAQHEAKRLVREHPEAEHGVEEVADVLDEEAEAAAQ